MNTIYKDYIGDFDIQRFYQHIILKEAEQRISMFELERFSRLNNDRYLGQKDIYEGMFFNLSGQIISELPFENYFLHNWGYQNQYTQLIQHMNDYKLKMHVSRELYNLVRESRYIHPKTEPDQFICFALRSFSLDDLIIDPNLKENQFMIFEKPAFNIKTKEFDNDYCKVLCMKVFFNSLSVKKYKFIFDYKAYLREEKVKRILEE